MNETTFTFRVDESLKAEFADAAKRHDRNAAQLLREFMRDFVRQQQEAGDYDHWFRQQVRAGQMSADAGALLPTAEVESRFAARRRLVRDELGMHPE